MCAENTGHKNYLYLYEWIKMPLDMEVGLRQGHIALDGDPSSPPERGTGAPNFRPM